MSTVGRYRPPREGYQPPSLPPKPPPVMTDRLSKSPVRGRDVPPAVPSPPTYSLRTSPPRPNSRRSAPSPAQSSPQPAPQARPDQWFFTSEEVLSTPSIIDGLSVAEERLRRAKGVNFIYQTGILLDLPQVTLWAAGVFFHRFYMRYSMVEEKGGIHHYNIAATALFLANKTEENCRKTKDIIVAVAKVAQKNVKLIIDVQSKEYWKWRDSILAYEELMLEALTFDLLLDNPYRQLYEQLGQLDLLANKPLRDAAWAFCNDACLTVLPLLQGARDIAVAAIFFSASAAREQIDDVGVEPWWRFLRGSEASMIRAVELLADFYRENPLRKQETTRVPEGSPAFRLEGTRREGKLSLSQMALADAASQCGTPTPMRLSDRGGTQSPSRGRVNGWPADNNYDYPKETAAAAVEKEETATVAAAAANNSNNNSGVEISSQMSRGDSDAALKAAANDLSLHQGSGSPNGGGGGLVSPRIDNWSPGPDGSGGGGLISPRIKRSPGPEGEEQGDPKRARLADEDEGEIRGF